MSTTAPPCCPPHSLPYLADKCEHTGEITTIEDEQVEVYVTGPSGAAAALLVYSDVWGWHSGRVRALADAFGVEGYRVYVPKLLTPPLEGGTDGDGLPPTFDLSKRGGDMMAWLKSIGPWSAYEPKVKALISYAKADGAKALGCVGFCWGGWASFHTSAMTKDVKCGVIFHPSCQLEAAHGGDLGEFIKAVQAPMYFMPSKDEDKELYGDEGTFIAGVAGSKTKYFEDMSRGRVD